MSSPLDPAAQALLEPWDGPYGGLPPLDRVTPAALEAAFGAALAMKRAEVRAIAGRTEAPSFANTVEALEDCGRALGRLLVLNTVMSSSCSVGEMPAVAQRLAPLAAQLDDEIAHDEALFARVDAVWRTRDTAGLAAEQRRLVEVLHERMKRQGAGLAGEAKTRLEAINGRLAELAARFKQNLIAEAESQVVFIEDESGLDGLADAQRRAAAATAAARGRPGAWAIANERGAVWPFLTCATRRALREQVWRMWNDRCDHAGANDNKPLIAETLQLRGEKAKLLGYPTFAHYAMADRMVRDPLRMARMLEDTWASVIGAAHGQIADYQAIADSEAAGIRIAPWDRQFYAEKLRRERFGLDGDAVKAHLPLDAVMAAMFWAAGRTHGLAFARIADAPVVDPACRAYEVSRGGEAVGVLYFDLLNRPGKIHGSYQFEYRPHESFRGKVLPIASVNSSFPPPQQGEPILLPWEYANVFFHEFGHALHMLGGEAAYPSLGSVRVAWDFVELPALINERWLIDGGVLGRFARHHRTGKAMPAELIEKIEQGLKYDRIFSLNPDYLLPAIVDLRMHLRADGSGTPIDAAQIERDAIAELGMPEAWDLIMRVTSSFHSFVGGYAAGVYVYLWADVMAADAAETFLRSAGGLYDAAVARSWLANVLSVGHRVPAEEAFRAFTGHDPTPQALQRRFGLAETPAWQ
ncbi:MAG: M3 family metallopeptidase [Burkholderiales bacterium]|nr:M3 family metallopeptidase [Burkholderiales bacterium]